MSLSQLEQFVDQWIPLEFTSEPARYERARLLVILTGAMAILSPFYAGIYWFLGVPFQAVAALVEGVVFASIPVIFCNTGRDRLGGHLFVGALFVMLLGKVWMVGGSAIAAGASLIWLLACPLLAAMLIGPWPAAGWGVTTIAAVFGLFTSGYELPASVPAGEETLVFFVDLALLTGGITILDMLFETGKRGAQA